MEHIMITNLLRIALFALLLAANLQAADKPNILLVMVDDMGFSDIGPYGSEVATPTLDRLAEEGMRFNNFHNTAKCFPTRAASRTRRAR